MAVLRALKVRVPVPAAVSVAVQNPVDPPGKNIVPMNVTGLAARTKEAGQLFCVTYQAPVVTFHPAAPPVLQPP
jgi:hypothetical protein